MIYLIRLIIWLIVIILISWGIHKVLNKYIRNKKVKPFIGVIAFLVIVLTPITIAKVAQVYYCLKYQPFYEIIKPLGDDFEGYYYENGRYVDFINLTDKYPGQINYLDAKFYLKRFDAKDIVRDVDIIKNNTKKYVYIRYFFDKPSSDKCINGWRPSDINMTTATHVDNFLKENKCLASKVIHESKVSRYKIGGKALEDKKLIIIPGIAYVNYHKSPVFTDRITGEHYAWGAFVSAEWDLYGVSGNEGAKPKLHCSYDFTFDKLKRKMIIKKNKGNNYGN